MKNVIARAITVYSAHISIYNCEYVGSHSSHYKK